MSCGWFDSWGRADEPKTREMTVVADQAGKGGEVCFPIKTYQIGGRKTIGGLSTDPSPQNSHRAQNARRRVPYRQTVQ